MTQPTSENPPKKQTRKKVKFERFGFYKVTWDDIVTDVGWASAKGEKLKPAQCTTYGWASDVDRKGVRLSATLGDNLDGSDLEYNQHIFIPIGCVQSAEKVVAP